MHLKYFGPNRNNKEQKIWKNKQEITYLIMSAQRCTWVQTRLVKKKKIGRLSKKKPTR